VTSRWPNAWAANHFPRPRQGRHGLGCVVSQGLAGRAMPAARMSFLPATQLGGGRPDAGRYRSAMSRPASRPTSARRPDAGRDQSVMSRGPAAPPQAADRARDQRGRARRRDGIERLGTARASIAVQTRTARRQIAAGRLDGPAAPPQAADRHQDRARRAVHHDDNERP
jgi:hypothetical protein